MGFLQYYGEDYEAIKKGYQVLSFDLPEHGDRKGEKYLCKVQNCVDDLISIANYGRTISKSISIFACSLGAYFCLIAYRDLPLKQCLFLSPVLDMERVIKNIMADFCISEEKLKYEQEIITTAGQTLYWDYYSYVKSHPISKWNIPTSILYGSNDNISEFDAVSDFVSRYQCKLDILEHGEHYFHTDEQFCYFSKWLNENISF
jgi:alpha-beta hydrolase superfamily lysophospholipase